MTDRNDEVFAPNFHVIVHFTYILKCVSGLLNDKKFQTSLRSSFKSIHSPHPHTLPRPRPQTKQCRAIVQTWYLGILTEITREYLLH